MTSVETHQLEEGQLVEFRYLTVESLDPLIARSVWALRRVSQRFRGGFSIITLVDPPGSEWKQSKVYRYADYNNTWRDANLLDRIVLEALIDE